MVVFLPEDVSLLSVDLALLSVGVGFLPEDVALLVVAFLSSLPLRVAFVVLLVADEFLPLLFALPLVPLVPGL